MDISPCKDTNPHETFVLEIFLLFPIRLLHRTGKPVRPCQIILIAKPSKIQISLRTQRLRLLVVCGFIVNTKGL